jgi:hypothetical protein
MHGKITLKLTLSECNLTYGLGLDSIEKNRNFIDVAKEVGPAVNAEGTKYILLSRQQNAGQNHDIKIANMF